jgi:hypothetical protein
VQVATDPGERSSIKGSIGGPVLVKEMAGASEKSRGVFLHFFVLTRRQFRVSVLIELLDALKDAHGRTPR